ncbi:MAG TPA: hypothetical protein PKD10_08165 [Paracoccaceae bacterium]|nr:hypothetical protein [Paracoccaceae bacterium]HMO70791.1 hypothetical protein [Paracoccaceae bacterium]
MRKSLWGAALLAGLAVPAAAQQFTTAAEVRPILEMTTANWVAVREFDGQDLVYFTHLLAWRCGLTAVRFSINSTKSDHVWPMEPCYEGTASPNAIKADQFLPYVALPLRSVDQIAVVLEMDDGTFLKATFDRAQVLMP